MDYVGLDILLYEKMKKQEIEDENRLNYIQLEIPKPDSFDTKKEQKENKRVIEIQF